MARQPFFGQGPGPLIARMDMNAATAVGREYGKAFREIGQAAGSAANAFIQRKNEKKRVDSSKNAFMQLGYGADVAAAMAKDPDVQNAVMKKEALDQQMEIARINDLTSRATAGAARAQKAAEMEMEEEKEKVRQKAESDYFGILYSSAPTGELNEAGQETVANFQAFAAPEDPRTNAFIQETLQNPEFQQTEPVMDMTGNRFAQQFAGESPEVQRMAFNLMEARQKDAPKPMTKKEQLDYQVKLNQELRDQAKEEREAFEFKEENKPLPPADSKYAEATLTAIDDALGFLTDGTKKFFSTGVVGQALSNIAGTDARSLRAKLDTITSGVGFGRLSDMREASKTGGALGNVSEIELRQLNASMGSLDPNQKPSELKKTLETIKEQYESTVKVLKAEKYAYDNGLIFKTPKEAMDFVNEFHGSSPQQPAPLNRDELLKQEADLQRRVNERLLNNPPVQQFRGI